MKKFLLAIASVLLFSTVLFAQATAVYADASVDIEVVAPRKMSVRIQDGTVLVNGSAYSVQVDQPVKFQMCANNWSNNTYNDKGNGLVGTVVYTFVVSSDAKTNSYDAESKTFTLCLADKTLRTDVNSCFMAYRFSFQNGNYNKQTGIKNVIEQPKESLSVNLPLGTTVQADAYTAMQLQYSARIFIERDADLTRSYTDYVWGTKPAVVDVLDAMLAAAGTTTKRCSSLTSDGVRVMEEAGIDPTALGIEYWFADVNHATLYTSGEKYNSRTAEKPYNIYIVYNQTNKTFTVVRYNSGQNNLPENFLKRDEFGVFSSYEEALSEYQLHQ